MAEKDASTGFGRADKVLPKAETKWLSLKDIENMAKKFNLDVSVRRIQSFIFRKFIDKPTRIGKYVYYQEGYIIPAIICILALKERFMLKPPKIYLIMNANRARLDALLDCLEFFIETYIEKNRPIYYSELEKLFLETLTKGNLAIDFALLEKCACEEHEKLQTK